MAARKQFVSAPQADPDLAKMLEAAKGVRVSEAELKEQRISFAFGNAPADADLITKDSVRLAAEHIRLLP